MSNHKSKKIFFTITTWEGLGTTPHSYALFLLSLCIFSLNPYAISNELPTRVGRSFVN
jgi:hypothetical protein